MSKITLPEIAKTYHDLNDRLEKNELGSEELFAKIQHVVLSTSRMLNLINSGHRLSTSASNTTGNSQEPDRLTMDIMLRVMRMGFIETISRIDFYSTKQLKESKQSFFARLQEKQNQGKRIYFSNIIEDAVDADKISKEDKNFWDYILHIRNCLVHNGGISDKDFETMIGELEVKKDKKIEGVIMDFYKVTEKPIELYSKLLKIF